MGYVVKVDNSILKQLRKQERFVIFLKEETDISIIKNNVLYFCVDNDKRFQIYGHAKIDNTFRFQDTHLAQPQQQKMLDTRNIKGSLQNEDKDSVALMNALSKGFEKRANHLKIFKDKKDVSFFKYAVEMGFAKNLQEAKRFSTKWTCAIVFDEINIYKSATPLEFFGNLRLARKGQETLAKICYEKTKTHCYQCPYVLQCLYENIQLRSHPMFSLDREFEEIAFLHATATGMRPL